MAGKVNKKDLSESIVAETKLFEPPSVQPIRARVFKDKQKKQSYFLGALAETASVADACHYVGATRVEVSEWRRDPAFNAAWSEALRLARSVIVDAAVDRAINGTAIPIVTKTGDVTGWFRRPSDGLLTTLL
jgi:hypothetical protein